MTDSIDLKREYECLALDYGLIVLIVAIVKSFVVTRRVIRTAKLQLFDGVFTSVWPIYMSIVTELGGAALNAYTIQQTYNVCNRWQFVLIAVLSTLRSIFSAIYHKSVNFRTRKSAPTGVTMTLAYIALIFSIVQAFVILAEVGNNWGNLRRSWFTWVSTGAVLFVVLVHYVAVSRVNQRWMKTVKASQQVTLFKLLVVYSGELFSILMTMIYGGAVVGKLNLKGQAMLYGSYQSMISRFTAAAAAVSLGASVLNMLAGVEYVDDFIPVAAEA